VSGESRAAYLSAQLKSEADKTRRHLERLPDSAWSWKPHEKSSSLGQLASHLVDCLNFAKSVFTEDRSNIDLATWRPSRAESRDALLAAYDAAVEEALTAMATHPDRDARGTWEMAVNGTVRISRDRESAFADMTLHHLIHHRGQLTVYLRLLDVPVASTYGPTADER
jgi:uncharacterized damage-inducible protein DinB